MEKKIETILQNERLSQKAFKASIHSWIRCILKKDFIEPLLELVMKDVHLMGSVADGCFSARFYSEEITIFECDLLLNVGNLQPDDITPVPEKLGFYSVKTQNLHERLGPIAKLVELHPTSKDVVSDIINQGELLLGDSVKKLLMDRGLEADLLRMLHVDVDDKIERKDVNGPAVTYIVDIYSNGKHQYSVSFDIVVAGSLNFWPSDAAEWPCRERKWPPQEIIDAIITDHDVHLVAKPVDDSSEYQNTGRLTFMAEKKIINEWSHDMKLTYYTFKILFYGYFVKEMDGEKLSSYLAKTTMFWVCEEIDPSIWTKERMVDNLKLLLRKLLDFLRSGILPHYFVRDINLLANVPATLITYIIGMDLSKLMEDPIECIPQKFDYVAKCLHTFAERCSAWEKSNNDIADNYLPSNTLQSIVSQFLSSSPKPFRSVVDEDLD